MATAKKMGHEITFVTSETFASAYASNQAFDELAAQLDRMVKMENSCDAQELRKVLDEIHGQWPVDALIGLHDEVVQTLAPVAQDMGIRFTDPSGVANARDKPRARELMAAAGLRGLEHEVVDDVRELPDAVRRIGFPAVVKPAAGSASIAAAIVRGPADIDLALRRIEEADAWMSSAHKAAFQGRFVVERYLDGPLMSIEIAALDGVRTPLAVLERRRYGADEIMELGSIAPARLSPGQDRTVRAYAQGVLAALGLDFGIFHIEVIVMDEGPCLIDPNPRLIGGPAPLLIKECWGIDLHEELINVFLGKPVAQPPSRPHRQGAVHILAPAADADVREGADPSFLDAEPQVVHWAFRAEPGQRIRQATSNFHYIGHVLAVADTCLEAAETCIGSVTKLAEVTGVPMITWAPLTPDE
ncbi:ATP-grasp domain-containing protein [Streptomyces californicus]|uniref:ATP-grasp domain-containing protein n=1 Tax=Streptomyces californicus TaxID=67351 RepID=UPI0037B5706C